MPNYIVTGYQTAIGTYADVEAELETFVESLDTTMEIFLLGINPLARDRDRCIGYALYEGNAVLIVAGAYHLNVAGECLPVMPTVPVAGAYHLHVAPNLTITTNP